MGMINTTQENGCAVLSIRRTQALNALSREVVDEIDDFLSGLDGSVRVLLIYSEKNFAAGADIKGMAECDPEGAKGFSFSPTYNKLAALKIPTIAAINGYALGGGLELALACDFRIAADTAKMGFPEINLGIMPGAGGTIRAARCVGVSAAMELILTGKTVTAARALELGLVSEVVPEDELFERASALAAVLAKKAPIALRTAKETILSGARMTDEEAAIALEGEKWSSLFATSDQKEGMRAFIEKRKPNFIGE